VAMYHCSTNLGESMHAGGQTVGPYVFKKYLSKLW